MTVLDLNIMNWDTEVVKSKGLVLVEFWHHRCPWCQRTEPIYNDLSNQYQNSLRFTRLNVLESQDNRQLAIDLGVRGTPTFIFFCNGRPVGTTVGFQQKDQLTQIIEDMIGKHRTCINQSTDLKVD